ncbi:thermonuclease family protein [Saccharomonospora saliphila]|uniref:thermonuclease family protein n=1 Tax=Saccharomonospora saliphila TaxID=369829 RepID=UPI0009FEEBE2|nr:thermonuclease family protein [Saccharomonospora saliphila]
MPTPVVPAGVPGEAQEAEVRRIVDGDTMELAALTGGVALAGTGQVDVRLLEIDAPETGRPGEPTQCYGDEATTRLTELAPPASTVWIQRDEQLRDPYGRHLLYLWNDEGTFVNLEMVEDGYADAVLFPPNDRYWAQISAAREDAEAFGAGLWGECASAGEPEQTPPPQLPPEPEPQLEFEPQPEQPPELEPDLPYQPEPRDQPEPEPNDDYVVPAPPPDLDCGEIADRNFPVRPGDPHRFDADGDGIGCED